MSAAGISPASREVDWFDAGPAPLAGSMCDAPPRLQRTKQPRRCAAVAARRARLAQADWLDAARSLEPASIDLLYADPPFNTGRTQRAGAGAFPDAWPATGDWIDWLRPRLEAAIPLLKPSGSILLHLDWRTCHHARILLDDLLGPDRFVNSLVWAYGLGGSSPRRFARKHDDILFYCVDPEAYHFEPPMVPATSNRMRGELKKATDVLAVPALNNMAAERVGWPTQKPLALMRLLVGACCPPGGAVLDPCCGSGAALVAAIESGRRAFGCDISAEAIEITASRCRETTPPVNALDRGGRATHTSA